MLSVKILKKITDLTIEKLFQYPEQDMSMFGQDSYRWGSWDWSTGVALYGIIKANEILKYPDIDRNIKVWIDARIDKNERKICVNTTAPLLAVLHLNKLKADSKYDDIFKKYDKYLMKEIGRIKNGAINHTTVRKDNPGQVWADTLFMSIIYLSQKGAQSKNQMILDYALTQLLCHLKILMDKESGLFYHGWDENEKKHLGVKWGRGNAWITASIIDILENIKTDSPEKDEVLMFLNNQLSALETLQDEQGFWKTVLDAEISYQETTVTAGIAYGLLKGMRLGLIDKKFNTMAEKAVQALSSKIEMDGLLEWASAGTSVKEDAEAYNQIPYEITPYAQGLALMAASEVLRK